MNASALHSTRHIRQLLRAVSPYLGPLRALVALLLLLSLTAGFVEAALMYLIVQAAHAIALGHHTVVRDIWLLGRARPSVASLLAVDGGLLLALVALSFVKARLVAVVTARAMNGARDDMVSAFLQASWRVQSHEREGQLQELLTVRAERIAQAVVVLATAVSAGAIFLGLLVSAVIVNPVAAAAMLVGVAALYFLLSPFTRITRTRSGLQAQLNSEYGLGVTELVALAREIRTFDVGAAFEASLAARAAQAARSLVTTRTVLTLAPTVYQYAALGLVVAGMALASGTKASGVAGLGAAGLLLVRALSYSQQVNISLQQAADIAPYLDDVETQVAAYRSDRDVREGRHLPRVERLALEDVSFSYDEALPVLAGVSFEVEAGEVVGVIGPSGGGKSTLVQILLRLRRPVAGHYLVNDDPADVYAADDWYQRFAFVPQVNRLLRGSVADNIRFHRAHVTELDIERAAHAAHVHEDIDAWPLGYATLLGSGARDVSEGQRQRLGLARALAGSPSVLVLDEPTSALDMRSETLIQQTLLALKGTLTLFIVAHRMTTLALCDRVLVLDGGRVQAFGTREELLATSPFFAEVTRLARLPV